MKPSSISALVGHLTTPQFQQLHVGILCSGLVHGGAGLLTRYDDVTPGWRAKAATYQPNEQHHDSQRRLSLHKFTIVYRPR